MTSPAVELAAIEKRGQVYTCGNLMAAPRPSDVALAAAYMRLSMENLLEPLFYDGPPPSLSWFLQTFLDPERPVIGFYRRSDSGGWSLEGFAWWNTIETMGEGRFRKAECGIGFFRRVVDTLAYGRLGVEWAFDQLKVDALFGTTPEKNPAAVRYIKRLGFVLFGPLPSFCSYHGELCAAWISALTRGGWEEQKLLHPMWDVAKNQKEAAA